MTYAEFLERQAQTYWAHHEPLPIDLLARMIGMGLDVDALERNYMMEEAANG